MIAGLAASLPRTLTRGLLVHGVPSHAAHQIGNLPPVSSLFSTVLGVNPVQHLLTSYGVLSRLPAASREILTGRTFFPGLIAGPFHDGLVVVLIVSASLAIIAGLASLLRGGRSTDEQGAGQAAALARTAARPADSPDDV
jgi:hypothetical protein